MANRSNNPFLNEHDLEANLSSPTTSRSPSQNPFLESPSIPPPAYKFHVEDSNILLPPHTTISRSPSPSPNPFKRSEDHDSFRRKQQYNRRRLLCCTIAVVVMIFIALVAAGVAFKWGQNNLCVRWNDGTTSGSCD